MPLQHSISPQLIQKHMEVQFNRANITKRVSRSHDLRQNFLNLNLGSSPPSPSLSPSHSNSRTSQLLRAPNDFIRLQKSRYKSDQDFRLMINLTIGRIYLYLLKIIQTYRITDKYSVRFHLVKALIIKILDALNRIPNNLQGIFYTHSSFISVIFKYEIEDILSTEANSIFQVFDVVEEQQPVRLSINLFNKSIVDNIGGEGSDERDEEGKISKSSYPFYTSHIMNLLKQLSRKNQYYYLFNRLDVHKNNCDLDEFDEDFERVKENKNKRKGIKQTKQNEDEDEQQKLNNKPVSREKSSAYQKLRKVFSTTSTSNFRFPNPKPTSRNPSLHSLSSLNKSQQPDQSDQNSIMKNKSYMIYFDNTKKQYKNPFNKSPTTPNYNKSSLYYAAELIQQLNIFIYNKMSSYDSFTLSNSVSSNLTLTIMLFVSFVFGVFGTLFFENYWYRCGILGISCAGFVGSVVRSGMGEVDSEETIREEVEREAKRLFRNQPFHLEFERGKYHMKLMPLRHYAEMEIEIVG